MEQSEKRESNRFTIWKEGSKVVLVFCKAVSEGIELTVCSGGVSLESLDTNVVGQIPVDNGVTLAKTGPPRGTIEGLRIEGDSTVPHKVYQLIGNKMLENS